MERMPHAPLHWFKGKGQYMITAGTYRKEHFFSRNDDLDYLQELMFELAPKIGAELGSWSFFSNHYHLIVDAPPDASRLSELIRKFHSISAIEINRRTKTPGRKVWYQYWDTCLTDERAYYSRLNYVNQNPVHHGIVLNALNYRWCSANWFESNAKRSLLEAVRLFNESTVRIKDDY